MDDNYYGGAGQYPFGSAIGSPYLLGFLYPENLQQDHYFSSLPEEVQESINSHIDEIHSEEELHRYVDNLMRKA